MFVKTFSEALFCTVNLSNLPMNRDLWCIASPQLKLAIESFWRASHGTNVMKNSLLDTQASFIRLTEHWRNTEMNLCLDGGGGLQHGCSSGRASKVLEQGIEDLQGARLCLLLWELQWSSRVESDIRANTYLIQIYLLPSFHVPLRAGDQLVL